MERCAKSCAARLGRLRGATAGLGRDSFVLADLGCQVTLCERNPVIAELLGAGLSLGEKSS